MSSLADRRQAALETFARAKAQGYAFNDWAGLAEELAALIPAGKTKGGLDRSVWADYRAPRYRQAGYEKCEFTVTFTDGEIFRLSHPSDSRKPYNWGEASRIAIAFWRMRVRARAIGCVRMEEGEKYERRLTAPAIVSMECNGLRACMDMAKAA